jgi:hypothetical protein
MEAIPISVECWIAPRPMRPGKSFSIPGRLVIDLDQRNMKTEDLCDTMTQLGFLPMVVFEHGPHINLLE